MSENASANVHDQISQLKRVVGKLRARAQDPSTPRWKKAVLAAVVGLGLAGAGYEGWRTAHAGPVEVKASPTAVEQVKSDETLRTTMKVESAFVTQSGLLLLNSKRDYRDPDNLTIVVPAGHGITKETRRQVAGKVFTGECKKSSYNGRPQLTAVPGKFEIR
jgi:hypothetical protein